MVMLNKNSVVWDGKQEGFYEAYYIQCNDPLSGMAWWFRYSIVVPKKGRGKPHAALWAVQYDKSGARGPVAMKHVYPINHFRYEKDRFILYIEDGFLTNSHATGNIKHGDRALQWDIQWVPSDDVFIHYPEIMYSMPFPKSKVVSPHWATTGGGFIRWNDGEFFLSDALIHVGHVWGTSHSNNWAWAHTHGFQEDDTAVFEGLWAPICGSFGMSMCWFKAEDKIERFTSFGNLWQPKEMLKTNEWPIKFNGSKFKAEGKITIEPVNIAGVAYHDPNGSHRFCYNSKVAGIRMNVIDKEKGDAYTLTAPNTASFEICLKKELENFSTLV